MCGNTRFQGSGYLKLYPNAELPTFKCVRHNENVLEMSYSAARPFGDLAHGLLVGCGEHFNQNISIERTDLDGNNKVRFVVTRN
jgi:hypothetical protein